MLNSITQDRLVAVTSNLRVFGVILFLLALFVVPVAFGEGEGEGGEANNAAFESYKNGMAALQSNKYDEAAKAFESVLGAGPTGEALENTLFLLGVTYFSQKKPEKAEEFFHRYLKEFPEGKKKTDALLAIAQIQLQGGRKEEAQETLKKVMSGSGESAIQAKFQLASMLATDGKAADADALLRPMIANGIKDENSIRAAMTIATIDSKEGHLDEALELLDKLQAASNLIHNPLQLDQLAVTIANGLLSKHQLVKALRMYAIVRPKTVVMNLQKERIETLKKQIADNTASLQKDPKAFMEVRSANERLQKEADELQKAFDQFDKAPDMVAPVRVHQAVAYDELDQKWESILVWESLLDSTNSQIREDAFFSIGADYCALARVDEGVEALDRYLKEFPTGKYASQAGYLKGATALENGDYVKAETIFGELIGKGGKDSKVTVSSDVQFLLANAQFAQGIDPRNPNPAKYKAAIKGYQDYISKYPTGKFVEECTYRIPLASFQLGDYGASLDGFQAYEKKFPTGNFVADVGYRIALCYQAANKYDEVIKRCDEWMKKYAGQPTQAQIMALEGDAYAAKEMPEKAAAAYREGVKLADTDEVLKYALFQASKEYQQANQWEELADMFSKFVTDHPQHPSVVEAIYWVSKAKIKLGETEEAKKYLAKNILLNINDRKKDAVEQLLTLLAQTCSKRPRPSLLPRETKKTTAGAAPSSTPAATPPSTNSTVAEEASATPPPRPSPTPLPPYDAAADFIKYLNETNVGSVPLAKARLRYALAQLDGFTKKPEQKKELMVSIYKDFSADQLSAMLLAECGDIALEKGANDQAENFYKELLNSFPKSDLLEYASYGMGAVALARNRPDDAIHWFDDAIDKGAEAKLADITFAKGKALLMKGKFDEAKKIFEEVAGNKEWRGGITAKAILSLGDLEDKRGNTKAAIQYYQRVFVAYQRYPDVVIPAYLKTADEFIKLGQPEKAAAHLRELLANARLSKSPLADEARKKLEGLPAVAETQPNAQPSASQSPPPSTSPETGASKP